MRFPFFAIVMFVAASFLLAVGGIREAIADDAGFAAWVENFKVQAVSEGISAKTLDDAFSNSEFLEKVIELDRKQPEKKVTIDDYLARVITQKRISNGRKYKAENSELLEKISQKYSVPASVMVALWGIETDYGNNTGSFNIISSLATLAYEGRRSDFFRSELINALKIIEFGHVSADDFIGSWAGAFGQCQFMPSSFLRYAVDFNGDGRRDIWNTKADVFASIANYLHSEGWNAAEGIEEGNNNYNVLRKWNRSRYFVAAVRQLADAIER